MAQRNARGHAVMAPKIQVALITTTGGRRYYVKNIRLRNTRAGSTWIGLMITQSGSSKNTIFLASGDDIAKREPCVLNTFSGRYEVAPDRRDHA